MQLGIRALQQPLNPRDEVATEQFHLADLVEHKDLLGSIVG